MAYSVKEAFLTLQGEGARSGRAAVFVRFAGCNLWSGVESGRATAVCRFCDTDFVGVDGAGGGRFEHAADLAEHARALWGQRPGRPYAVCTGGEPMLQLDAGLVEALHTAGFEVAIETNGTLPLCPGIDWVCVSPKVGAELVITRGDELKVVIPQPGLDLDALTRLDFQHRFLQPMDGLARASNTRLCIETCLARPEWRLSLQTHKLLGIP